jgi:hypothetical protein
VILSSQGLARTERFSVISMTEGDPATRDSLRLEKENELERRVNAACFAAALSWILGRRLAFDPVKSEFIGG